MLNSLKYLMSNIFFRKNLALEDYFSLTNAKYYTTNIKGHFPHEFHAKNVLFIHSHQPDSLEMDFSNQPDNLYYPFNLF